MKTTYPLLLGIAFVTIAVFALQPNARSQTTEPSKQEWRYKVLNGSNIYTNAESKLNDLGKDGWELVSVTPATEKQDAVYYLKRN